MDPTIAIDLGTSEDTPYLSSCGGWAGERSLSFEPLVCSALALGGQLTIESSPGRGTTVRLRVPARSLDVGRTPTGQASRVPTRDLGAA